MDFLPLSYVNDNPWYDLWLLTPEEVSALPSGFSLTSINCDQKIKGEDTINLDTRFGYTAWGVTKESFEHLI